MIFKRFAIIAAAVFALAVSASAVLANSPAAVDRELLVGMTPIGDVRAIRTAAFSEFATTITHESVIHTHRIRINPGIPIRDAISRLRLQPGVLYVEQNHIIGAAGASAAVGTAQIPNDPLFSYQWAPHKIQGDFAWALWKPQSQVVIAVIDTGVDSTHPDLINKMLRNGTSVVGYDAINQVPSDAMDICGHGTICAGIAVAEVNNGIGIAGIAGITNSGVYIMPVRALDANANGTEADVANGIIWAANNGANVINLSLGGSSTSQTVTNAISYAWQKGCIIVASAGNNASSAPFYPAATPNVIAVAATDTNDQLASFSNYGSWISVAAPGVNIASTLPTYALPNGWPTNYGLDSGTSMAAAHVSAEAAILESQNPALTNSEVRAIILQNVDPYLPISGRKLANSVGRINVFKAIETATQALAPVKSPSPPVNNPTPQITVSPPPAQPTTPTSPATPPTTKTTQPAPPPAPTAPSALKATAGDGVVSLTWGASSNTVSYTVLRSTQAAGTYTPIAVLSSALTYTDVTATDGTTYYYIVRAANSAGVTASSATASATPQAKPPTPPAPPTPPTNLAAISANTCITLKWTVASAVSISSIRIYKATGRYGRLSLYQTIPMGTTWSDNSQMRGETFNYAVTGVTSGGVESAQSNQVTIVVR